MTNYSDFTFHCTDGDLPFSRWIMSRNPTMKMFLDRDRSIETSVPYNCKTMALILAAIEYGVQPRDRTSHIEFGWCIPRQGIDALLEDRSAQFDQSEISQLYDAARFYQLPWITGQIELWANIYQENLHDKHLIDFFDEIGLDYFFGDEKLASNADWSHLPKSVWRKAMLNGRTQKYEENNLPGLIDNYMKYCGTKWEPWMERCGEMTKSHLMTKLHKSPHH